ncbi:MAG: hypothetical protein IJA72_01880 [Clostridia bacterium]|nr:hypothetical protein [Clostridia bacterium]
MNQSRTKAKVLLIAFLAIIFVCALFVIGIVEIKKYNDYKQQISAQEQLIKDLQNAKNYYSSDNYDNNESRDNGNANNGDITFTEE